MEQLSSEPSWPDEQSLDQNDYPKNNYFLVSPDFGADSFKKLFGDHNPDEYRRELEQANLEKLAHFSRLSPAEQLRYLSDVWEEAETDVWFPGGAGKDFLAKVTEKVKLSPFMHVVIKAAKLTDPDGERYRSYDYEGSPNENLGYDSIVRPNTMSIEKDLEIIGLSEPELKTRLAQAKTMTEDTPPPSPYADWYSYILTLELVLSHIYYDRNQEKLHQEFPDLPEDVGQLVRIASDAAISVKFQKMYDDEDSLFGFIGSLDTLSDNQGHVVTVAKLDNTARNPLGIDRDMLTYLEAVHCRPRVKELVEETLGLNLTGISLGSQVQLLKYMTEADSTRYDNLCQTLHAVPEKLRLKLAEAFLAADFSPDFGDALLDIANSDHVSPENFEKLLDALSSCRVSIHNITSLYSQLDNGAFSEQYSRAANERLTDALAVFRDIANKSSASADLDWAGTPSFTFDKAFEALGYEATSLSIISGTMEDVITGIDGASAERVLSPDDSHSRSFYSFYSPKHGYVLLYTRPEGSSTFDSATEYGKFRSKFAEENNNAGVEASISFITNPLNPFALPTPFRPGYQDENTSDGRSPREKLRDSTFYDHSTMDKVSALRLDREGRALGDAPNDPSRSPINPIGTISVDLAAIGDRPDTPSGKIARLLSTGNKLRSELTANNASLNHNTRWFDQSSYGTAAGFKKLVQYLDTNALILTRLHPPKKGKNLAALQRAAHKKSAAKTAHKVSVISDNYSTTSRISRRHHPPRAA